MAESTRRVSDQETELRRKLAILCRIVGMQDSIGIYGHISLRVPDTDIVLLTPGAGNRKTRVRTDQIFVFNLAGSILNHPGGDRPLSIPLEWRIHTRIHRDRPNLPVVVATGYAGVPSGGPSLPRLDKPYKQQELADLIARLVAPLDSPGRVPAGAAAE